jgi:hypothetical protein
MSSRLAVNYLLNIRRASFMRLIKNNKGESIAETLVGILIALLSTIILVSMIIAGSNGASKSETAINNFYAAEAMLDEVLLDPTTHNDLTETNGTLSMTKTGGGAAKSITVYSTYNYDIVGFTER